VEAAIGSFDRRLAVQIYGLHDGVFGTSLMSIEKNEALEGTQVRRWKSGTE
jgi:hypothetical protein